MSVSLAFLIGFLTTVLAFTTLTDFDLAGAAVALVDFLAVGFLAAGFLLAVGFLVVFVFALVDVLRVAMHLLYHERCYTRSMSEIATIGGGCYWCLDAFYRRVKGVEKVESGYAGGHTPSPTTQQIYTGTTGHAEVIQVTYDPSVVSYRDILEIFFVMHDPTTLNRQGNDVGEWYRSIILYHDDEQQRIAQSMIDKFATELYKDPVVTELVPYSEFWPAGEDAQDFYTKNQSAGYCMIVIDPKIQKLRQKFAAKLVS